MSSPLQMTHMSCASVSPTIQWCSALDFLSEAPWSRGTQSKPTLRRHWRTTPVESTLESAPSSLKPIQSSVAPAVSGSGAVDSRTGRPGSRRS